MKKYNPQKVEKKWQKYWEAKKFYVAPDRAKGKKNFYFLVEFPYSSGNLHIGHWYTFSVSDIVARYWRMKGRNVMYPIGFDAFGLPAENAAIKNNLQPEDWTRQNIARMAKQCKSMGAAFDWSRVVSTIDPEYYKWTQWIFLQFYKKGLAYRAKTLVNWCPKDKTVLANEQVVNGCCDRCATEVVQKELAQWMYKITEYADRLLDDLEDVDWPEVTKTAQRNWIGRSRGAEINFLLPNSTETIKVFTTRADTLFGATYLVLAPEHPLVTKLTKDDRLNEVGKYFEEVKKKSELERTSLEKNKTGVFTGAYAINPINNKKIPIWVADYAVGWYGTGAIMAVPAHDERDFAFAQKYDLPIKQVIAPYFEDAGSKLKEGLEPVKRKTAYIVLHNPQTEEFLCLDWGKFGWRTFLIGGIEDNENAIVAAQREIREETGYKNVKFVRKLGDLFAGYFAAHKNENRLADAEGLLFELIDEARDQISEDEQSRHSLHWIKTAGVEKFLRQTSQKYVWSQYVNPCAYVGEGILINSKEFNGFASADAREEIVEKLAQKKLAERKTNYKLHDWILSRQRYWGTPIPVVRCVLPTGGCGYQPVPEKDLPVKLPRLEDYKPSVDGRSPLAKAKEWLKVKCPKCGKEAERETDTMDTFVDSSWYFLRYTDPKNKKEFASSTKMKNWLPVNLYIGGAEHNTMHLLYSRFFTKALHDLGFLDFDEAFTVRRNRGDILGPDGQKMSKSRGNVVDPDNLVEKYGADTVRMYLAFMGPYEHGGPWNPTGINGVSRFLNRVWNLFQQIRNLKPERLNPKDLSARTSANEIGALARNHNLEFILHKAIKKIGEDIQNLRFNTAVSELMKLLNEFESFVNSGYQSGSGLSNREPSIVKQSGLSAMSYQLFLKLLAPFAPHLAEEIWMNVLGNKQSIHLESWPEYDPKLIIEETIRLVVQVNGKTRDVIEIPVGLGKAAAREAALASGKVNKHIAGREIKKAIYVPDRLINLTIDSW